MSSYSPPSPPSSSNVNYFDRRDKETLRTTENRLAKLTNDAEALGDAFGQHATQLDADLARFHHMIQNHASDLRRTGREELSAIGGETVSCGRYSTSALDLTTEIHSQLVQQCVSESKELVAEVGALTQQFQRSTVKANDAVATLHKSLNAEFEELRGDILAQQCEYSDRVRSVFDLLDEVAMKLQEEVRGEAEHRRKMESQVRLRLGCGGGRQAEKHTEQHSCQEQTMYI
eukprot:PhM_4_TR11918/c0_g1_i1/m.80095